MARKVSNPPDKWESKLDEYDLRDAGPFEVKMLTALSRTEQKVSWLIETRIQQNEIDEECEKQRQTHEDRIQSLEQNRVIAHANIKLMVLIAVAISGAVAFAEHAGSLLEHVGKILK